SCPPTISPCFYGIDTPRRSELIAATHTLDEITTYLDADSVGYLSLEGLMTAVGSDRGSYCSSCYTGKYPVEFPRDEASYLQLALKLDKTVPVAKRARVRALIRHEGYTGSSVHVLSCVSFPSFVVSPPRGRRNPTPRSPSP